MQTDHRVTPGDDQDQHLHEAMIGRAHKIDPQQVGIVPDIGMEDAARDAGGDDVAHEENRDSEPEGELTQLGPAQAQCPPLPQRVKRQTIM
jgi:hypothetical protein